MTAPLPSQPGTLSGMKADGSRHAIHQPPNDCLV